MSGDSSLLGTKIPGLELIVFDLDYTLWPFYVDCHADPPFKKDEKGILRDLNNSQIKCYSEVPQILEKLSSLGYQLGLASRTHTPKEGRQLVNLFGWDKYINHYEIFPGCKTVHFGHLEKKGFSYDQMLFFDDESRNIRDVGGLGVVSILVKNGVNNRVIEEGLRKFIERHPPK